MKYLKLQVFLFLSLALLSCQQEKREENNPSANSNITVVDSQLVNIDFQIAKNYFVKNTIDSISNPLIESQVTFDSIFGMATTMGEEGKPTAIDFTKQSVIAMMLPATNLFTEIIPSKLSKNNKGQILYSYAINLGEKSSATMVPCCVLIINKEDAGEVILNEIVIERN
jgi:hypothetical protein